MMRDSFLVTWLGLRRCLGTSSVLYELVYLPTCTLQGTVAALPPFGGAQIDLQPGQPRVAIFSSSYASRCIWL